MKRIFIVTTIITLFWNATWFLDPIACGAVSAARQDQHLTKVLVEGQLLATEISKAVGVSISPLLGMSALGAYHYWTTPPEERAQLKWHSSPLFWGPLLIILLACIAKDSAKTVLPIPKPVLVPLDALEAVENKISGLIGVVFVLSSIFGIERGAVTSLFHRSIISIAYAGEGLGVPDPPALITITLLAALALFCFLVVWLVSHTINILILLCPFSSIDLLLKMFRNFVLVILLGASLIDPYLGLAVSLTLVILAYLAAGWSFRFMVFGSIFSFDILSRQSKRYVPGDSPIGAFAGQDCPAVPAMSYGTLTCTDQSVLEFSYRPWLALPAMTIRAEGLSEEYEIGKGTLSPILLQPRRDHNSYRTLFRLRPRYKSHEESVADSLGITSISDVAMSRGIREGWKWLAEQLRPAKK